MTKAELIRIIRENALDSNEIASNVLEQFKNSDQFKQLTKLQPNKLAGTWPGEDLPKQKMHNYDDYELRDGGGFDTFSDFLKAVRQNNFQALDKCIPTNKDVLAGQAPGSMMIPSKFAGKILSDMGEADFLRPLCTSFVLPRGAGEELTIPVVDADDFSSDEVAGVKVAGVAEGGTYGESTPKVRQIKLKIHKLGRIVDFSEEVLFGSPIDMSDFISNIFSQAGIFMINKQIIKGTGASQCLGIQNGGDLKSITAESGQSADTLVAENIFSMLQDFNPYAWNTATWLCSIQNIGQLLELHVKLGTGAAKIDVFNQESGTYSILGRKCIMNQHMGVLGDAHSIMLCNFKKYALLSRDGMMIRNDQGIGAFSTDTWRFKFTMMIDGQPINDSTITMADSETYANFVSVPAI